ncbi:PST family polysaccharide transporter/antigen flippase [Pseudomonas corrugata]|uniref:O-antigen translocase n=1 Tax=Pseudomonas corrugata TaxID=47879 RepID=UPI002863BBC1|nr:O-antigen translocase [Pseudomonas corrugata]MDR7281950.1 PST family polysaccharide transporter/antigen flippase [Pseudomonas corrugata]
MSVLSSAILTSCAHLSRIMMGFILLKIIAHYLGAEGMGALGHFMSVSTMIYMIAGGGVINAVIKYAAEYARQPIRLIRFISASATYSAIICLITFFLGLVFSKEIAAVVFKDSTKYWIIVVLVAAQILFAFVNLVVGVSNGLMQTNVYSRIQIFGSFFALPIIWWLTSQVGLSGAALSIVVMYGITFIPAFYFYWKSNIRNKISFVRMSKIEFRRLSSFTLMLLASAVTFPVVEIVIRQVLINSSGYSAAGIWQGAIKLSSAYLGFFTVFLAYYFMPMISRLDIKRDIGLVTLKFAILLILVFGFGAGTLYYGRAFFIPLILSSSFSDLDDVIIFQLVGDFFKVLSYVIGFVAVAKAATKIYIAAEVLQNILFLLFSLSMLSVFPGAKGVMIGYAVSYIIYFLISAMVFVLYLKTNSLGGRSDAVHS